MPKRTSYKRNAILAALAAASLAAPRASAIAGRTSAAPGPGGAATAADTAYGGLYRDSTFGGTGMGPIPGRGGSSGDSAYGRDTLWSSPYDQPATPGTGLPNSPGSGLPGTGRPGSPGNGGTGTGGSGTGDSSRGAPEVIPPAAPEKGGATPRDSIGASEWMERG